MPVSRSDILLKKSGRRYGLTPPAGLKSSFRTTFLHTNYCSRFSLSINN